MELMIRGLRVDVGGGPGSRGGHVIGRTKSGKAVYENHNHPSHAGFSSADHKQAAVIHERLANTFARQGDRDAAFEERMGGMNTNAGGNAYALSEHHAKQAQLHRQFAKQGAKG